MSEHVDDSCYVDAKQYHLASFSTCNSTLNTSLRKSECKILFNYAILTRSTRSTCMSEHAHRKNLSQAKLQTENCDAFDDRSTKVRRVGQFRFAFKLNSRLSRHTTNVLILIFVPLTNDVRSI